MDSTNLIGDLCRDDWSKQSLELELEHIIKKYEKHAGYKVDSVHWNGDKIILKRH